MEYMQNSQNTFYAHTQTNVCGELLHPDYWEPLFTHFGAVDSNNPQKACAGLNGEHDPDPSVTECIHCKNKEPMHGHLNKVAYWTSEFAKGMLPENHPDRENLARWGYVTGLWHDLGKFQAAFQRKLNG